MKVKLFVTCGRGLDAFVKEEIFEKIPRVCDVDSLGEGKIAFSIQTPELPKTSEVLQNQFSEQSRGNENERTYGTNLNEKKLPCIKAIVPVYKLKLVERLFVMIYCEEIGSNNIDETKMMTILKNADMDAVASLVLALKKYQEQHEEDQVLCCKPDSCPGSINRRTDKEEIKQKRMDILSSRGMVVNWKVHENNLKRTNGSNRCDDDEACIKRKRDKMEVKDAESESYSQSERGESKCSVEHDGGKVKSVLVNNEVTEHESKRTSLMISTHSKTKNGDHIELKESDNLLEINHKLQEQNQANKSSINYRVSCRITGKHKGILTSTSLTKNFVKILENIKSDWVTEWANPLLDLYVNITDLHFILGVTLSKESLSLRRYISHITLRSTTSYLMAKLCCLSPGDFLLDPMCGGGTILAEAAKCFKVGQVIGGDVSGEQLEIARCNLRGLGVPFSLILGRATKIPLNNGSINAVVCDFPFGKKHKLTVDNQALLQGIIGECYRLLVTGGRAVFLLSSQQYELLTELISNMLNSCTRYSGSDVKLKLESAYPVTLGRTLAYVAVILKGEDK